jgi:hypothetical protein
MLIDVSSTWESVLAIVTDDKVDDEAVDTIGVEDNVAISIKFIRP